MSTFSINDCQAIVRYNLLRGLSVEQCHVEMSQILGRVCPSYENVAAWYSKHANKTALTHESDNAEQEVPSQENVKIRTENHKDLLSNEKKQSSKEVDTSKLDPLDVDADPGKSSEGQTCEAYEDEPIVLSDTFPTSMGETSSVAEIHYIKLEPELFTSGSEEEPTEDSLAILELSYCKACDTREPIRNTRLDARCEHCQNFLEYQCGNCRKMYKRVKSLRYHIRHDCNKEPTFHCEHCEYKTTRKASLQVHVKCKHSILKSFHKCGKCGRRYKHRFHMLGHEKHCGRARIKCELCDHTTNRPSNLKLHMRNMHQDPNTIELYECFKCNRTYKHSRSFYKHKLNCGKVFRRDCAHCDYYTSTKFKLLVHILQNHKEEVFPHGRPNVRQRARKSDPKGDATIAV